MLPVFPKNSFLPSSEADLVARCDARQSGGTPLQTLAIVGTYRPRQCGIATFSSDLRNAIALHMGDHVPVVAIDDDPAANVYGGDVRYVVPQQSRRDYHDAADMLNVDQIDCTLIQHEYGIFGGDDGELVLEFAARLRMPLITTLHTILTQPSRRQRAILEELVMRSARVVVMTQRGRSILESVYDVPGNKVVVIPHGIHDQPFSDPHYYAEELGLVGKRVLLTFGLMGPGKGLETVIQALPQIVKQHPNVVYLIVGATHPHVLRREGTRYRDGLIQLADKLGVKNHIRLVERFVTNEELGKYLGVADVYVIPYPHEQQVTSGTLAYAVGAGKAVCSTPFWHASELLDGQRGCLFGFGDSAELARNVTFLLSDDEARNAIRRRAYQYSRESVWPNVGKRYVDLASQLLIDRRAGRWLTTSAQAVTLPTSESKPKLDHLVRLTDDTGLLQHARFTIPDREHGYCTDDNARALIAAIDFHAAEQDSTSLSLADRYLGFLNHAWNRGQGRFRNFMSYDRKWLEEVGSEDSQGRAMWALGHAAAHAPMSGQRLLARALFNESMKLADELHSPRAWAFAIIGLSRFCRRHAIENTARVQLRRMTERLTRWMDCSGDTRWPWPESEVTYDNARIPQAMIEAGKLLGLHDLAHRGVETLRWIIRLQHADGLPVSLIGNQGWLCKDGRRARFDQQPLEVAAIIDACEAAQGLMGGEEFSDAAKSFYLWFLGANDLELSIRDVVSGGCADGLHATGVSFNQGAESTLAWFMSSLAISRIHERTAQRLSKTLLHKGLSQGTIDAPRDQPPARHRGAVARLLAD